MSTNMWDGFVNAVGGTVGAEPNPETVECVEVRTRTDGFGRQLARLFAIEPGQLANSKIKTEGLGAHYGISEDEIVSVAAEAFKANWLLLDGVEKARA